MDRAARQRNGRLRAGGGGSRRIAGKSAGDGNGRNGWRRNRRINRCGSRRRNRRSLLSGRRSRHRRDGTGGGNPALASRQGNGFALHLTRKALSPAGHRTAPGDGMSCGFRRRGCRRRRNRRNRSGRSLSAGSRRDSRRRDDSFGRRPRRRGRSRRDGTGRRKLGQGRAQRAVIFFLTEPAEFHQAQFDAKPLVHGRPQRLFDGRQQVDSLEQQRHGALGGLRPVAFGHAAGHLEQGPRLGILAHQQVAEMAVQPGGERLGRKAFAQYLVKHHQRRGIIARENPRSHAEVGIVVEHIQRCGHLGSRQPLAAERDDLVEHRQRVAHASVGFLSDNMQRFVVIGNALLRGDVFQVTHAVLDADPVEIVNLAAGQNRRDDLVLLGRRQNEHGMRGRLLKRLEESVEGLKRKHMDLVDDVDAVTAYLRRDTDLFGQRTNIVHRVVRCGVQFVDIERAALVERPARLALVAGLAVGGRIEAVDRLGENTRAGRFADAARAAEQVSVGQLPARDRVAQRRGDMRLPDDRRECRGTVLAGGNDEIIHDFSYLTKIRKFGRNPQAARKNPGQGGEDTSASFRHRTGRRMPPCAEAAMVATDRKPASIPRDAVERTSASAGPAVCSGPTRIWERTAFAKDQKRMLTSDMPLRAERPGTPLPESMRGVLFCHPDCQDVTGRQLRRDNSSYARRRSVRTD